MNVDLRAVAYHCVDILHLSVADRDAAPGPIGAVAVLLAGAAMDEDVAAGIDVERPGAGDVGLVRVVDSQRQMEGAFGVSPVDDVRPFGRPAVALDQLVTRGREAEVDLVRLEQGLIVQKIHPPLALVDDDAGHGGPVIAAEFGCAGGQERHRRAGKE